MQSALSFIRDSPATRCGIFWATGTHARLCHGSLDSGPPGLIFLTAPASRLKGPFTDSTTQRAHIPDVGTGPRWRGRVTGLQPLGHGHPLNQQCGAPAHRTRLPDGGTIPRLWRPARTTYAVPFFQRRSSRRQSQASPTGGRPGLAVPNSWRAPSTTARLPPGTVRPPRYRRPWAFDSVKAWLARPEGGRTRAPCHPAHPPRVLPTSKSAP